MKEAIRLCRLAARHRWPLALYTHGFLYHRGKGVPKGLKRAAEFFAKAAKLKHRTAPYELGLMYEKGQGVKKDLEKDKEWYQLAAIRGLIQARNRPRELAGGDGGAKS